MSKYFKVIPDDINVFSQLPMQLCIRDSFNEELDPINSTEHENLEFNSIAYPDKYKDLSNIYLRLRLQILKADNGVYDVSDSVQPDFCNNLFGSLFRSVHCTLNGVSVRASESISLSYW